MLKLNLKPRQFFLLDGLGALLSAFLLGVVLVQFESLFGMPVQILYVLAAIAGVFAIYSFSCYFQIKENWPPFLKAIATANLLYCGTTAVLVVYHYHSLSNLGILYFVVELIIVVTLATIELKAANKHLQ